MRFFLIFLSIAALACTKKAEPAPPEAASSAETAAPAAPVEPSPPETEADPKLEDELAAELESAEVDLPETLQGATPPLGKPAAVALLEAGSEPRAPLRFTLPESVEQKVALAVGSATEAAIAVIAVRNPEYVVSYDLVLRASKQNRKGETPVTFRVEGASIDASKIGDAKVVKLLEDAEARTAPKLRGSFVLSPLGQVSKLEMSVPKDAKKHGQDIADDLRLAILALIPALPEQPVGVGAKWTAHEGIEQGGVLVNQLRSFELMSRDGGTAELKVSARQTADRQPYESQGTKYELETLRGDASGTLRWNATLLLPPAAALRSETIDGLRHEARDGRAVGLARKIDRSVRVGGEK